MRGQKTFRQATEKKFFFQNVRLEISDHHLKIKKFPPTQNRGF